ncbi:odorant receptor 30a-like [Euwallacea fornicatus]|uniref:odorant receptor 30a-like n=1 Tax=Euwallacea fornicatus TaxID=995702 RepID=UPI00338FCEE2
MLQVYPKCHHLNVAFIFGSLMGITPWQFMFPDNSYLQRIYAYYSNSLLGFFVFFLVTCYIDVFIILTKKEMIIADLTANLGSTLLYSVIIARLFIFKLNPLFVELLWNIIYNGKSLMNEDSHVELQEISKKVAKSNRFKIILYLLSILAATIILMTGTLLTGPVEVENGNETVRSLSGQAWLPFDQQINIVSASIWFYITLMIGASFVNYTDILMLGLILYPIEELKFMQHVIKNFDNFKRKREISNAVDSSRSTFIDIMQRHQAIIEYVKVFNSILGFIMLVDFLQSSLHIAVLLKHVILNKQNLAIAISESSHLMAMIVRPFFYYYCANEVTTCSHELITAVCESNWYDRSRSVQMMLLLFTMRANKPLVYNIGPFGIMTMQSFINVMRIAYSYATLLLTF